MSVPESAPVGSVVGRIWARDRDIGVNAEMKYSIIDGDGRDTFDISTDPTNLFGIITVKKVLEQINSFHSLQHKMPNNLSFRGNTCSLSCIPVPISPFKSFPE